MKSHTLSVLLFFLLLVGYQVNAQQETILIEPHLGVTYDSTLLKTLPPATNSVYNTASVIFKEKESSHDFFSLMIRTDFFPYSVSDKEIDDWINSSIEKYKTVDNDSIKVIEAKKFASNGYVGVLTISKVNTDSFKGEIFLAYLQQYQQGKYATTIVTSNQITKDKPYQDQIDNITKNIKPYNRDDSQSHLLEKYSITVKPIPYEGEYPYRVREGDKWVKKYTANRDTIPKHQWLPGIYAFQGEVIISPTLENLSVSRLFVESQDGVLRNIYIRENQPLMVYCREEAEGVMKVKAYLVLLTQDGQELVLPFNFEYK